MAQTQAVPPGHGPSLIPPAEGDGDLEQLPPPPPPTVLRVDRAPDRPAAVTVETHSMSVQWAPCSVTVESPQIAVVEYLLTYVLSMQQVVRSGWKGAMRASGVQAAGTPCTGLLPA